jgi:hypothetical protein
MENAGIGRVQILIKQDRRVSERMRKGTNSRSLKRRGIFQGSKLVFDGEVGSILHDGVNALFEGKSQEYLSMIASQFLCDCSHRQFVIFLSRWYPAKVFDTAQ